MKILKGLLILLLILTIIGGVGFSYFIGNQVFEGSTRLITNEGTKDGLEDYTDFDKGAFEDTYTIEELEIRSSKGDHIIPADYIYTPGMEGNKDHKTVILVHGLGGNRYTNYPIATFFLTEGYNVITYDQRNSNENYAERSTFGYLEKFDLIDYINYVRTNSSNVELGLWGTSFGGATVGLALGTDNISGDVDFAILDCPVSSMKWMVEENMKGINAGIPIEYLMLTGNIVNKLKLGFTYEDAEVPNAIAKADIPVFVINSTKDDVTPEFMGADIYKSLKNNKSRIWTTDASHANIFFEYPKEYADRAKDFIDSTK